MHWNKIIKKLMLVLPSTFIPLVSSACTTKEEKKLEEYFKTGIIDFKSSEHLKQKSYDKEIKKFDNKYNLISKKELFNKTIRQYNNNLNLPLDKIYENYKNYNLNPDNDLLQIVESKSMQELIDKYITSKRSKNKTRENELKYIQDVNSIYYDTFDTSLSYLIDKYVPDNLYVYDVYNYVRQLLSENKLSYFANNDKDNLFSIYANKKIKSMIEIPVKIINWNRNNFINELNIAYNQESEYWDVTDYENEIIKKIINNRNIEIDPIKQNMKIYDDLRYEKIDKKVNKLDIIDTEDIDKYLSNLNSPSFSKSDQVTYKTIRRSVVNPYYSYYINNLLKELNGVEGYQISYYGTKVRLYLDHDVNEEDLQKIKNWAIYDEYIPKQLNVNWLYDVHEIFRKNVDKNLRNREMYYINNFSDYKDFILGTRIFADMRSYNSKVLAFKYIKNGSSYFDIYDKKDDWANVASSGAFQMIKWLDPESTEFKEFLQIDSQYNANDSYGPFIVFSEEIQKTGSEWTELRNEVQELKKMNIYPSLTAAIKPNSELNFKILNYTDFTDFDYNNGAWERNLSDESSNSKIIDVRFIRNNSWYDSDNYSILPEKTFINNKSTIFKQLLQNNYEYKYNLDWKTVSYSFIPYDLEGYEGYNQNYNNLLNYLQDSLKNNNIELARIGIDQLSVR